MRARRCRRRSAAPGRACTPCSREQLVVDAEERAPGRPREAACSSSIARGRAGSPIRRIPRAIAPEVTITTPLAVARASAATCAQTVVEHVGAQLAVVVGDDRGSELDDRAWAQSGCGGHGDLAGTPPGSQLELDARRSRPRRRARSPAASSGCDRRPIALQALLEVGERLLVVEVVARDQQLDAARRVTRKRRRPRRARPAQPPSPPGGRPGARPRTPLGAGVVGRRAAPVGHAAKHVEPAAARRARRPWPRRSRARRARAVARAARATPRARRSASLGGDQVALREHDDVAAARSRRGAVRGELAARRSS